METQKKRTSSGDFGGTRIFFKKQSQTASKTPKTAPCSQNSAPSKKSFFNFRNIDHFWSHIRLYSDESDMNSNRHIIIYMSDYSRKLRRLENADTNMDNHISSLKKLNKELKERSRMIHANYMKKKNRTKFYITLY